MLFSDNLIHDEVSRGIRFSTRFNVGGPAISAGFVKRDSSGQLVCSGKSESLGIAADPEDTPRLQALLNAIEPESEQVQLND